MDRGRRAEPYSNATIWTREIARNLAGHLERVSKAHSCVDTRSPKTRQLPQFHHPTTPARRHGSVSPLKARLQHLHDPEAPSSREVPGEERHNVNDGDEIDENDQGDDEEDGERCRVSMTEPETGDPLRGKSSKAPRKRNKGNVPGTKPRSHHESNRYEEITRENQRLQEQLARIEGRVLVGPGNTDGATSYETTQHKRNPPQDYHKRQEQIKIWHENQALAKRLRDAKPTLRSKDWERDDKWNQHFLRTQERRRLALQQEMMRTLASPHSALVRVRPGRGETTTGTSRDPQHHDLEADDVHRTHPTDQDENGPRETARRRRRINGPDATAVAPVAVLPPRDLRRRRSSGDRIPGEGEQEPNDPMKHEPRRHATAANHRRILQLREQRASAQTGPAHKEGDTYDEDRDGGAARSQDSDELVSVRFTFSREGRRVPEGLVLGQFSPAVELESALEALTSDHNHDAVREAMLVPAVPILQAPNTSRLDVEDEDEDEPTSEHGRVIWAVLQECIDVVVARAALIATTEGDCGQSCDESTDSPSQSSLEHAAQDEPSGGVPDRGSPRILVVAGGVGAIHNSQTDDAERPTAPTVTSPPATPESPAPERQEDPDPIALGGIDAASGNAAQTNDEDAGDDAYDGDDAFESDTVAAASTSPRTRSSHAAAPLIMDAGDDADGGGEYPSEFDEDDGHGPVVRGARAPTSIEDAREEKEEADGSYSDDDHESPEEQAEERAEEAEEEEAYQDDGFTDE